MDGLVVQGEISAKILTLRGQQVMIDRDIDVLPIFQTSSPKDYAAV